MKTAKVKGPGRVFPKLTAVAGLVLLAAIIWVFSTGTRSGCSEAGGGIPLLSATSRDVRDVTEPLSNESEEITPEPAGQWQTVEMRVTAYCPCESCCGEYADGITACGHQIQPGDAFVAADGEYEFGTEMVIPGYSHSEPVKVLDRGGAIQGDRLDVFFHSHQEALNWGVKYLQVKVRRGTEGT
ncbi:MAG: 3D domain-containing protein [Planctomycetota bacterium]